MKGKVLIIIILLLLIMAGIVHERIVASRDKGLAVDWNADHKITGNVDFEQHQSLNHVLENRTDYPAGPVPGQIIFRSDFPNAFIWDGSKWVSLSPVATIVVAADGTGNYTDVQDGIDALPAGGGVVYIKEGVYTITASITIPNDNISLIGSGKSTQIIQTINAPNILVNAKDGITFKDIWIYGTGTGGGFVAQNGISFTNSCTNCTIEGCWIEACDFRAIWIQGAATERIIIRGNHIIANDIGIHAGSGASYCIIQGNICYDGNGAGIGLTDCLSCVVIGNICENNNLSGIYVEGGSNYNIFSSNRCEGNGDHGIDINGAACTRNIIIGNTCLNNAFANINDSGTNTHPNGASGTTNLALDDLNIIA